MLLHLANEVRQHGNADKYLSAYPFENFNQFIKKLVRSRARPLQQIMRRLEERQNFTESFKPPAGLGLYKPHTRGPLAGEINVEHEIFKGEKFQLGLSSADNGIVLSNGKVGRVRNILLGADENVKIVTKQFTSYDNFYEYPLPSNELGFFYGGQFKGIIPST